MQDWKNFGRHDLIVGFLQFEVEELEVYLKSLWYIINRALRWWCYKLSTQIITKLLTLFYSGASINHFHFLGSHSFVFVSSNQVGLALVDG